MMSCLPCVSLPLAFDVDGDLVRFVQSQDGIDTTQWKEPEDVVPGTVENIPSDCLRVFTEWTSVLEARGSVPGEF
jgi:hypothetical protein